MNGSLICSFYYDLQFEITQNKRCQEAKLLLLCLVMQMWTCGSSVWGLNVANFQAMSLQWDILASCYYLPSDNTMKCSSL